MNNALIDVIILGAGPAGATTSVFLAKQGIKHIIMDKATFPRDKICGDALSGKSVAILNRIDPALTLQLDANENHFKNSWGVQFVAPNGKALNIPFSMDKSKEKHAPGFISKRLHFDQFMYNLIDENYAQKRMGCRVKDVIIHNDKVEVCFVEQGQEQSLFAKMVIGAEGDRSIVAKKCAGHKMKPESYAAGLRAYYKNVRGMHPENFIELHFIKETLPGYLWVFPLPDNQANVGIGVPSDKVKKLNINLKKTMLYALEHNPNLKKRFKHASLVDDIKGWGLPLGSEKKSISGARYLLTGDAASLIDPFTGEGIGNAMVSGFFAAETAVKALKEDNFSADFLNAYDQAVYHKIWDELKLSHTIQKMLNYPKLFNFIANRAEKNKTISETISCMFYDLDMRARLKSPMFYLKLLFNL